MRRKEQMKCKEGRQSCGGCWQFPDGDRALNDGKDCHTHSLNAEYPLCARHCARSSDVMANKNRCSSWGWSRKHWGQKKQKRQRCQRVVGWGGRKCKSKWSCYHRGGPRGQWAMTGRVQILGCVLEPHSANVCAQRHIWRSMGTSRRGDMGTAGTELDWSCGTQRKKAGKAKAGRGMTAK
jgi:hypothetical protein